MLTSPRAFGVPHDEWRVGQFETVKHIASSRAGVVIVQAPVGSGKTAVGKALQKYGTVTALTHTKYLQDQYAKQYDFYPLYGLSNYECVLLGKDYGCNSCLYSEAMYLCPLNEQCIYLNERSNCIASRTRSLSYAYFLLASWVEKKQSRFLYMDEAHLLPNIVKDFCTVEFTPEDLQKSDLPMYDTLTMDHDGYRVILAVKWLAGIVREMQAQYNSLMKVPKTSRSAKMARKIKLLSERIFRLNITMRYARKHPNDFYAWADENEFKLVPLTAKLYFKDLFINRFNHKAILTSATIGNPDTLAAELGIGYFDFRDVPSAFSPEEMPVFTFKDMPRLGYKTKESGWKKWADKISGLINKYDPSWPGLIHVSSRRQANFLAESMATKGLQDRVYIAEGKGTHQKINNWHKRKNKVPNTIAIAYSFHMGLDAPDLKFNIIGKIPFKTLDRFGMAELRHNPSFYRLWAAILTEQAAGRIRRGEPEHYESSGRAVNKVVAIADGNYPKIQSEFSSHFQNCLTEYD